MVFAVVVTSPTYFPSLFHMTEMTTTVKLAKAVMTRQDLWQETNWSLELWNLLENENQQPKKKVSDTTYPKRRRKPKRKIRERESTKTFLKNHIIKWLSSLYFVSFYWNVRSLQPAKIFCFIIKMYFFTIEWYYLYFTLTIETGKAVLVFP